MSARINVVENVYWQTDGNPLNMPSRFAYDAVSSNNPAVRNISVSHMWQKLDFAWVKDPIFVILFNKSGIHFSVYPTPEEKTAELSKVVEVSFDGVNVHQRVHATHSLRLCPACDVYVRGTADLSVSAFPR